MSVRAGHSYQAVVRVGSTEWDVTKGDAPTFGPMLPLVIGWQMPQTAEPLPAPEPMTCSLSLILESADDADDWDIGTVVYVRMFLGVDDGSPTFTPLPSVVFAGRIAQMEGKSRRVNGVDAYQLDLTCIDYTADLAEYEVAGSIPFQGIGVASWMDQLFILAGLDTPDWTDGGFGCAQLTLDGGKLNPSSLLAAAERLLSTYADGGEYSGDESNRMNHDWWPYEGWRRGMLTPVIDEDTGELLSWSVEFYTRRNTLSGSSSASTFPMVLADTGTTWDLVLDRPDDIPGVIDLCQILDAGYVDFGATWKRTKNTAPTVVIVANNTPPEDYPSTDWRQVAVSTTEDRAQVANRVTEFMGYQGFNAQFTGELLTPDVVPYRDVADGFTYYASSDPAWPIIPSWFPGTHQLWFGFSIPLLVTGIPDSQNPGPHRAPSFDFYTGTLGGCVFRLEPGGVFRFDVTLRPGASMPGGIVGPSVTWAQLQVDDLLLMPSITPLDLNPALTVHDIRLARRHDISP